MKDLGIYVHIPFCGSKCAYCDFYSVPGREDLKEAYAGALREHFRESARFVKSYAVDTVYFGGGTPTVLGDGLLVGLLKALMKDFAVSRGAEVTLEANPGTVTRRGLAKLRRAGFNRLSLGMQCHDDAVLRAIGRGHVFSDVLAAFEDARHAGFDNISLDIIYGLPGQSMESWRETLQRVFSMRPEHVSCYGLKLEEGTPLYARRGSPDFPDEDRQAEMYLEAVEMLGSAGYMQYEISNFALKGFHSRHNMKYWTLGEYLGFGPSAHSDFGGLRYSCIRDVEGYIRGIRSGDAVIDEKEEIPLLGRADEYLMLGLRTAAGISTNKYMSTFRAVSFEPIERVLERYREQGYAQREGDRWHLTPKGFLISNRIIGDILASAGGASAD